MRNRTADLFNAIEALSQLSYDPGRFRASWERPVRAGEPAAGARI